MTQIPICVAPMMGMTDRHCRFFHRLISPSARLYTPMITTGALLHGPTERLLAHDAREHPVALQLGGSDPQDLANCAALGAQAGYDEINLNCGCPSDRVQRGNFGACLMMEPGRVAACVAAMAKAVHIPITVKCRVGVDEHDDFAFLMHFAQSIFDAGADALIVHARKCWLKGVSPRANRAKPPLEYEKVWRLKEIWPNKTIILNGGITNVQDAGAHTGRVDGLMIGRAAYYTPWLLAALDSKAPQTRQEVIKAMAQYIEEQAQNGVPARSITRHMSGLMHGQKGAARWRIAMANGDIKDTISL